MREINLLALPLRWLVGSVGVAAARDDGLHPITESGADVLQARQTPLILDTTVLAALLGHSGHPNTVDTIGGGTGGGPRLQGCETSRSGAP